MSFKVIKDAYNLPVCSIAHCSYKKYGSTGMCYRHYKVKTEGGDPGRTWAEISKDQLKKFSNHAYAMRLK